MGEILALGAEAIAPLFESAAPAFETGVATIGADALGAAAGAGGSLADIVGTGAGLFGGAPGLEGTLAAGGAFGGLEGALGAGGATALGTAESFLANPAASGFNPAAGSPGWAGFSSESAMAGLGTPSASMPGGSPLPGGGAPTPAGGVTSIGGTPGSVFQTGAAPVNNIGGAPTGGVLDPTAAGAGGQIPGAAGPTSVGGAPVAGGTAPTSSPSLVDQLLGGAKDSLTKNPLGTALGGLGLGYNILQGQKQTANQKALSADAAQATANSNKLAASGEQLQQYLTTGKLPDAYQQQVDNAIKDARTSAISNAAAQGLSTDPTRNTALAATLARIEASRGDMQAKVAQTLFQSGTALVQAGQAAAGLSGQLYQALVANDTAAAANTGKAIATLAAALNGKSSASAGGNTFSITPSSQAA